MIEFRWIATDDNLKPHPDGVIRFFDYGTLINSKAVDYDKCDQKRVVLQWRTLYPYMAASGDVVMSNNQWTDWQTVPFIPVLAIKEGE